MKETTYSHPEYPTKFIVTELEPGESKGWAGDSYVSHGPSIVILEKSAAAWNWAEYDNPSDKAQARIDNIIEHGWTAE